MIPPLSFSVTAVVDIHKLSPQWRERFSSWLTEHTIPHCIDGSAVTFGPNYIWGVKNVAYLKTFSRGVVTIVEGNSGAQAKWICTSPALKHTSIALSIFAGFLFMLMLVMMVPWCTTRPSELFPLVFLVGMAVWFFGFQYALNLAWQWWSGDYLKRLTPTIFEDSQTAT